MSWLTDTPLLIVEICATMMPRLQAEDRLGELFNLRAAWAGGDALKAQIRHLELLATGGQGFARPAANTAEMRDFAADIGSIR